MVAVRRRLAVAKHHERVAKHHMRVARHHEGFARLHEIIAREKEFLAWHAARDSLDTVDEAATTEREEYSWTESKDEACSSPSEREESQAGNGVAASRWEGAVTG